MRELTVRLRFTAHCLGSIRKHYREKGRLRNYYVLPRSSNNKIIFMPTWWAATLRKAADILCKHHKDVVQIRFALEVEGVPRDELYRRYFEDDKFSQHEAYYPGDVISVTCVVPAAIDDDDFYRLMNYAGKYCGISPGHPNKFGFYVVESVMPTMPVQQQKRLTQEIIESVKREELPSSALNGSSSMMDGDC